MVRNFYRIPFLALPLNFFVRLDILFGIIVKDFARVGFLENESGGKKFRSHAGHVIRPKDVKYQLSLTD